MCHCSSPQAQKETVLGLTAVPSTLQLLEETNKMKSDRSKAIHAPSARAELPKRHNLLHFSGAFNTELLAFH